MSTDRKTTPSDYAPAAITGSEDAVFQEPLDQATDEQFCNLVKDLAGKSKPASKDKK